MSGREQPHLGTTGSPAVADLRVPGCDRPSGQTGVNDLVRLAESLPDADMLRGMLHELNQPLGAIANYSAVCLQHLRSDSADRPARAETAEVVSRISEQSRRATDIVRRIGSLVAGESEGPTEIDVNEMVENAAAMIGFGRRPRDMVLKLAPAGEMPSIIFDRMQLLRAVSAVLKTAIETSSKVDSDCRRITIGTCRGDEETVEITIEESRRPRADKALDRPLSGENSGIPELGPAIARAMVESLGGRLEISFEPQSSVLFRIVLPIQPKELKN